jgi:hypothetical protein
MGYSTDFCGSLKFNKPVEDWLVEYINKLGDTRRMKRDPEKIKEIFPDWKEKCFNGDLGVDGGYFIGSNGFMGQEKDESVVEYNYPPYGQPGLWCQWIINGDLLEWDGGEKFYNYVEWLEYLIEHFFAPLGYVLNGDIEWQGEDYDDFGTINVVDNVVTVQDGIRVSSMSDFATDVLIEELENRGYTVTK